MGLPAEEIVEALVSEGLPRQPANYTVAVKTTSSCDCFYNAVSLALGDTKSYANLLRLLTTLDLLLNADFSIRNQRLASISKIYLEDFFSIKQSVATNFGYLFE